MRLVPKFFGITGLVWSLLLSVFPGPLAEMHFAKTPDSDVLPGIKSLCTSEYEYGVLPDNPLLKKCKVVTSESVYPHENIIKVGAVNYKKARWRPLFTSNNHPLFTVYKISPSQHTADD